MFVCSKIFSAILIILTFGKCAPRKYVPVVLWHGLGDKPMAIDIMSNTLRDELPGVYVKSVQIGRTDTEDLLNSFFLDANEQVERVCQMVRSDSKLKDGFNAIGRSQGGLFLRALVQRCPEARVRNLITLGSPHQGVYGFPNCAYENFLCDLVRRWVSTIAYKSFIQDNIVPSQYWKDPRNLQSYLSYSAFLADINNERPAKNGSYATNLGGLDNFVMVRFNKDKVVRPKDTSWFAFYTQGQAEEIQALNQTALYKEDWLGLQGLDRKGRLHFLELDGGHVQFSMEWFISAIVNKYLR